jgi:hypothetical protein
LILILFRASAIDIHQRRAACFECSTSSPIAIAAFKSNAYYKTTFQHRIALLLPPRLSANFASRKMVPSLAYFH